VTAPLGPVVYLTVEDLITLATIVTGGPPAVRDHGLLASAAARPATVAFGHVAYPDLFDKAAALLHSICMNHALVDGNKRLAWSAAVTFLALNGHAVPDIDVDAAEALVLGVAAGKIDAVSDISRDLRGLYGQ
jgi:death-on-curing protein